LFEGLFADRSDAGRVLGEQVAHCEELIEPVVVALPRGGVPVGAEVARRIGARLVAMPVGKVGAPGREELAIGAVAPGGVKVLNHDVIAALRLSDERVEQLVARAAEKVARQAELYKFELYNPGAHNSGLHRSGLSGSGHSGSGLSGSGAGQSGALGPSLNGCSVVVVDDGLATGASMWAALIAVREQHPRRVILAVPVAPPEPLAVLAPLVDEEICIVQPVHMQAVGAWYEDFSQTTDAEVAGLLAELARVSLRGP
jgi:putative phosphoribosyl transferase